MLKKLAELPGGMGGLAELAGYTSITTDGAPGIWNDPHFLVHIVQRGGTTILSRPYHMSLGVNDVGWALMCGMYFNEDCLHFLQHLFADSDVRFNARAGYGGAWEFGSQNRSVSMGYGLNTLLSGLWKDKSKKSHSALYIDDHPLYAGEML